MAARERAVVAQNHHVFLPEMRNQPRALIEIERDAFVVVVYGIVVQKERSLADRQQPLLLRRYGNAGVRVQVQHALHILAHRVHGAMNSEAGRVNFIRRGADDVSVEIDLYQRRRGDFAEHHPVRIDQEMLLRPRNGRRDVGIYKIVPTVARDQTIASGEANSRFPLGIGHVFRS